MPPLNWPFLPQRLKLKAQGWQFTKHRAHFYSRLATHRRFFQRLRRRQNTLREPHLFTYIAPLPSSATSPNTLPTPLKPPNNSAAAAIQIELRRWSRRPRGPEDVQTNPLTPVPLGFSLGLACVANRSPVEPADWDDIE